MRRTLSLLFVPIFLLLFISFAFAANIYVDVSCTYNGDGTTAACASSDGGAGAYNNLSDPLANATSGDIIWVRRGSSDISISSTLSPTNDGTEDNPIKLVGWPYYEQVSGTVDGAISGKEKFGFYDAELTATDKGHYCSAEIEFTSGSNNGLKRKIIFYQYDSANSRGEVYLFPDLPNNISAGDQYTITLETELWNDRPQEGQDAGWDSDDYVRPVLDGGGASFNMFDFANDLYWHVYNLKIQNLSSAYHAFYRLPAWLKNILIINMGYGTYYNHNWATRFKDYYAWDLTGTSTYRGAISFYNEPDKHYILEDVHIQGNSSVTTYGLIAGSSCKLKNFSAGKVQSFGGADIRFHAYYCGKILGENVGLYSTNKVQLNLTADDGPPGMLIAFSGYNSEPDKFHQWWRVGEIYNVDEDATIDPPSGATTYIKFVPNSHCNSTYPLKFSFNRRQAASAKTYTFKVYIPSDCTTLTTSDIYADVWYLDESSGTHRKEETHNISTVNTNAWNDLSFSITPGQEGTVYIDIVLQKYESGCYIALDPKFSVE